MKKDFLYSIKMLFAFTILITFSSACEYKDIADADYPEQLIYMPAAKYGIFYIDNVALPIGSSPTPGNPYRYVVDINGNIFNIPLGVYRSGIDNKGGFTVNITVNTDTITRLIQSDILPIATKILTPDKYSLQTSVEMVNGNDLAKFDLGVRLDSMVANYENGTIFALGVSVSSNERKTNPALATTVIVIDTKMMKPEAAFTSNVAARNATFTNTSLMSLQYKWNFGDGSPESTEESPIHSYTAPGNYTVTLTAIGISGEQHKSIKTAEVTIL